MLKYLPEPTDSPSVIRRTPLWSGCFNGKYLVNYSTKVTNTVREGNAGYVCRKKKTSIFPFPKQTGSSIITSSGTNMNHTRNLALKIGSSFLALPCFKTELRLAKSDWKTNSEP